ncbi:MAG: hypothetical protein ABR503_02310 [Chitinophagaceae bacterium]
MLISVIHAQKDSNFHLVKSIKLQATDFALDNLNNLYILSSTDQLKKFNEAGDSIAVYNDVKRFGKLYSIDVTNPLKILLYYKDFSTIVILDRLLSVRASVDLRKQNIAQATAVGSSYDNNIWIFDAIDNKLKKIDENGNLLLETVDFRTVFEEPFAPQKILDINGSVHLYDSAVGLLAFDHYGSFQKKYPLAKWQNISVFDKNIAGIYNNNIILYNTSNLMQKRYQFPSSFGSFNQYIIGSTRLFTLTKDSVNIYNFRF